VGATTEDGLACHDQPKPPGSAGARQVHEFRPINALPYWDVIGNFIRHAVLDAATRLGRPTEDLYPAVVPFVLWCWQTRGTPLEVPRIFRWQVLEEFIHRGMTEYMSGSRATHRSTLTLVVKVLNPADVRPDHRPIPRSRPTEPYTSAEVASLYGWATSQGTARRKQDALALLALGLGAGLATREILGVRTADIDSRTDQLLVMVWEGRPRTVPILESWQTSMRQAMEGTHPNSWVFRPGRVSATSGQITDFLQRARTHLDVRPARMRTTWLLEHLATGTAPAELLRISGLKNLAALDKITQFTPRTGVITESFGFKKTALTRHLSSGL
jgi:hypothetical protein